MNKKANDFRTYTVAKLGKTDELDELNRLGGRIYSKTVSTLRKIHKRKGFWLSKASLQKYLALIGYPCHSHTVQAITDDYYEALGSYLANRESNPDAKPPYRTPKFHSGVV